jgi:transcriptional regulator GlxA family with amidase domain
MLSSPRPSIGRHSRREFTPPRKRNISHMDQRVQQVKSLIESSFHRELSVSEMARLVDLSVSHLQHLFKNEMGQSPAHYVQELRLSRAKELLESSSLTVKQIMLHIGTKDRSNFERRFKQTYKLTPVQYRKVAGLHTTEAWPTMEPDRLKSQAMNTNG